MMAERYPASGSLCLQIHEQGLGTALQSPQPTLQILGFLQPRGGWTASMQWVCSLEIIVCSRPSRKVDGRPGRLPTWLLLHHAVERQTDVVDACATCCPREERLWHCKDVREKHDTLDGDRPVAAMVDVRTRTQTPWMPACQPVLCLLVNCLRRGCCIIVRWRGLTQLSLVRVSAAGEGRSLLCLGLSGLFSMSILADAVSFPFWILGS